jgi:hypothetical protein
MTTPSSPSIGESAKNFLTSQEKHVGALFSTGVVAFGFLGLYAARGLLFGLFDFGINLLGRAIMLGALGLVATFLVMLAMNPQTYTEIWHLQRRVARWVSDRAMKADPFGRMRAFADEFLGAQYEKFEAASVRIQSLWITTRHNIAKHEEALENSSNTAQALKSARYKGGTWQDDASRDQFRLESQRITLTEDALKKSRQQEAQLAMLVKIVDRWRNTFKFEIESTRMSADFLESQWHQANEMAGAVEAASSVFGHGDMARADKEVRAYIDKLTSERMAKAEVLMKQIPELTALGDLRGDVAEQEVMARLQALDDESQRAFVEVQADRSLIEAGGPNMIADVVTQKVKEPAVRRYLK